MNTEFELSALFVERLNQENAAGQAGIFMEKFCTPSAEHCVSEFGGVHSENMLDD
ncbi:MAG: hypothetical protein HY300_13375 [Verrucomicrobia bacterium]|nr:hypothetical protein [Verrucomicrobiota bacterium]